MSGGANRLMSGCGWALSKLRSYEQRMRHGCLFLFWQAEAITSAGYKLSMSLFRDCSASNLQRESTNLVHTARLSLSQGACQFLPQGPGPDVDTHSVHRSCLTACIVKFARSGELVEDFYIHLRHHAHLSHRQRAVRWTASTGNYIATHYRLNTRPLLKGQLLFP